MGVLALALTGGQVVLCEHKIEAPETLGTEGGDEGAVRQLERYLRLHVDGVAYFRSSWKPPATIVLDHPKYVKPKGSEHFLWRDLYPALQLGTTDVTRWLAEGFESLGYTPAHPSVGDLADRDDTVRSANKQNFAKIWQRTRSSLRELGWKVGTGSVCELYLRSHESAAAGEIYITPLRESGRILLIRVTPAPETSVAREGMGSVLIPSVTEEKGVVGFPGEPNGCQGRPAAQSPPGGQSPGCCWLSDTAGSLTVRT